MSILASTYPDVEIMLKGATSALEYGFLFLRYMLMILSIIYFAFAFLNLYSLSVSGGGQLQKLFPSRSQPTNFSATLQLVLAGLMMITAITLLPVASMMDALTGDNTIRYYSVGSYDAGETDLFTIVKTLLDRAFVFIGLLAYLKAAITWWKITNGESQHSFWRVLGFIIFGTAFFGMDFINALVANTIGFDMFGFLLGTT